MAAWSVFVDAAQGRARVTETQLEQAVAVPGLAVVVAFRRRSAHDLDLAVIEAEAARWRDLRPTRARWAGTGASGGSRQWRAMAEPSISATTAWRR